jgi:hypothetical protein
MPIAETLGERLRRPPVRSSVPGSLPVLFFGDLFTARAVTVGLNPSRREYLSRSGDELTGPQRRFETLASLGCADRASLTDDQCRRAIERGRAYFRPGGPAYRWFRPLGRVLKCLGYRYQEGEAAHLDLVQEATDPTWSRLPREEAADLLRKDLPFLRWEIEAFPLEVVACNGRTVFDHVRDLLDAQILDQGRLARITWWVARAQVGERRVGLCGWNLPLAQPTGLGADGERELGRVLRASLQTHGILGHGRQISGAPPAFTARPRPGDRADARAIGQDDVLRAVRRRRRQILRFLVWAAEREATGASLRWKARADIDEARQAAQMFEEPWWGVVVFSAFGSLRGTTSVADAFSRPIPPDRAQEVLQEIAFPQGSVGHHRTRPGLARAKDALISACEHAAAFREILLHGDGFRGRFEALRALRARQWGRTTCFDLLLRAGALGIGGSFAPDRAYLDGSTGPKVGFERVWGIPVRAGNAAWCEVLLGAWMEHWDRVAEEVGVDWVAEEVGVDWPGAPYDRGDLENALCVFQEQVRGTGC